MSNPESKTYIVPSLKTLSEKIDPERFVEVLKKQILVFNEASKEGNYYGEKNDEGSRHGYGYFYTRSVDNSDVFYYMEGEWVNNSLTGYGGYKIIIGA